jgi:DNA-binding transcriptional ArsR family regulator
MDETMDFDALAEVFGALSNPKRLTLLKRLRTPQVSGEIEVPNDRDEGGSIARQTVIRHLERLVEVHLVHRREIHREGRDVVEFSLNHQNLYLLSETVRGLARMRPALEPAFQTSPAGPQGRQASSGPCLVVARGLDEGVTFDLGVTSRGDEWLVGRRRDVAISLDYDPSISGNHARVSWDGTTHVIEDLGSRNGTYVNFQLVPGQKKRPLRHGDLIGVGRSLLAYWSS